MVTLLLFVAALVVSLLVALWLLDRRQRCPKCQSEGVQTGGSFLRPQMYCFRCRVEW